MSETAVIILHYLNEKDTYDCINSLKKSRPNNIFFDLFIVTNSLFNISDKHIHLIKNALNKGFAAGMNEGIRKARKLHNYKNFILLNNDTSVSDDLIFKLIQFNKENNNLAIISPKIYFAPGFEFHKKRYTESDKGRVIWYAGGKIDWKNVYMLHKGVDMVDKGQFNNIEKTDFCTGCCLLIPSKIIDKIGLFDEKYFLYFEDVDFSVRAKKAGFKNIYYPYSHLWHKNAASSGKSGSPLHVYYQTRNRLYFGFKYALWWTKKSLIIDSLRLSFKNLISARAVKDYYLRKMGQQID